jgi:hypothetical protein
MRGGSSERLEHAGQDLPLQHLVHLGGRAGHGDVRRTVMGQEHARRRTTGVLQQLCSGRPRALLQVVAGEAEAPPREEGLQVLNGLGVDLERPPVSSASDSRARSS